MSMPFGKEHQRNERDSFTPVLTLRYAHYPQGSYRERNADSMFKALPRLHPHPAKTMAAATPGNQVQLTHTRAHGTVRIRA